MRSVGTARALLSVPSILLLDEPTEGLDAVNERKVMRNIVEMRPKGQTCLAIAHRLSSIKDADMIIFLGSDGTIKEMGTWNELVNIPGGHFAKFRLAQNINGPMTSMVEPKSSSGKSGDIVSSGRDQQDDSERSAKSLLSVGESNKLTHSKGIMTDLDAGLGGSYRDNGDRTNSSSKSTACRDSNGNQSGEEDKIVRAVEAVRDLRKLASAEAVPFDLVKSLADACDKVWTTSVWQKWLHEVPQPGGPITVCKTATGCFLVRWN